MHHKQNKMTNMYLLYILIHKLILYFFSSQTWMHDEIYHPLSNNWKGHRECHITPDWLLIYRYEDDVLILTLARTGSHSDLFGK